MSLPDDKGTHVLVMRIPELKRNEIGRLGAFDIRPGFYAYVGSAFGVGGLRARLGHHIESVAVRTLPPVVVQMDDWPVQ